MQESITLLSLALMASLIGVFIYVATKASQETVEYPAMQTKAYRIRRNFFFLLLLAGAPITLLTTLDLPFAATRGNLSNVDRVIDVEGRQWFWQMSDNEAKVGETVVFRVTTADVNHGLGIYDENMRILGQTQAMPGYTNSLKMKFDKPGTYKLLCMEYCGLAHHAMVSELVVK